MLALSPRTVSWLLGLAIVSVSYLTFPEWNSSASAAFAHRNFHQQGVQAPSIQGLVR